MLKGLLIASPVVGTALYLTGTFDTSGYPRTVEAPPGKVMAALADLDIREQPGSPGSTAVGGTTPRFRLVRGDGRLDWVVMSGSQVATTMTATFEPDGEGRTRISAWVERGDAPEAQTSPAFRSEGLTLALFSAALDTEIDEMTAIGWGPECDGIRDELLGPTALASEGMAMEAADTLPERMVAVGGAAAGIARIHRQLLERGCNPDAPNPAAGADGFVPVHSTMGSAPGKAGWSEGHHWGSEEADREREESDWRNRR